MRKYNYNIQVDFADFSDWDLFKQGPCKYPFCENLWDSLMEWESPVYFSGDYYLDEYTDTAITELKKQGFTEKEIKQFSDTLDSDILRACNDAYMGDLESKIIKLYEEKSEDPGFIFSDFEYLDIHANPVKHFYEAVYVNYGFSQKIWKEVIYNTTEEQFRGTITERMDYAEDELDEYVTDNFEKLTTGNRGDFDYTQENASCDKNFIECFKDYNETSYEILEMRKDKQSRIKGMIKAHVPLITRQSVINSIGA